MGRNLFGIAGKIREGYGIDVNPHYIKLANKLTLKRITINPLFSRI